MVCVGCFLQSGIAVSDELLALYEQVKLRKAHKYIIFSLKKTDAAGRTYEWSIDYTAAPNEDIAANQVLSVVLPCWSPSCTIVYPILSC